MSAAPLRQTLALRRTGEPAQSGAAGITGHRNVAEAVANSGTAEEARAIAGDLCGFRAYVGVACLVVLGVARSRPAFAATDRARIDILVRDAIARHGLKAVIVQVGYGVLKARWRPKRWSSAEAISPGARVRRAFALCSVAAASGTSRPATGGQRRNAAIRRWPQIVVRAHHERPWEIDRTRARLIERVPCARAGRRPVPHHPDGQIARERSS